MRSQEQVEEILEEMIVKNKGKYITQGVAFNKECPRQMSLLKQSLLNSKSFSGLVKEMLAVRFKVEDSETQTNVLHFEKPHFTPQKPTQATQKNVEGWT